MSSVIYAVEIIVVFGYDSAAVCIPGSHSWSIPFVNPKLITTTTSRERFQLKLLRRPQSYHWEMKKGEKLYGIFPFFTVKRMKKISRGFSQIFER